MTKTKGADEWADHKINCYYGCPYNCTYCYAKRIWEHYKNNRKYPEERWDNFYPNLKNINKGYRKRTGRFMFPTAHDIINLDYIFKNNGKKEIRNIQKDCFTVIGKILNVGNDMLITSKPNYKVMIDLMKQFKEYKDQIQFRYTITTKEPILANKFEPYAPSIEIRVMTLIRAFRNGFKTSISIEPFLDENPVVLISKIGKFCTESIWLGTMSGEKYKYHHINNLKLILNSLKNLPNDIKKKVRLKDSIVNILKIRSNKIY